MHETEGERGSKRARESEREPRSERERKGAREREREWTHPKMRREV